MSLLQVSRVIFLRGKYIVGIIFQMLTTIPMYVLYLVFVIFIPYTEMTMNEEHTHTHTHEHRKLPSTETGHWFI